MLVEVRANSVQSAVNAQLGGADVIELCSDTELGGRTTPSLANMQLVKKRCEAKISVLIRPRIGDYVYNDLEFELMRREIAYAKKMGADGVSFGITMPSGRVDKDRVEHLVALADTMTCTFNHAFDLMKDPFDAASDLVRLGIDRIVTSGKAKSAKGGKVLIAQLQKAFGHHLQIVASRGIDVRNVEEIVRFTKVESIQISTETTIKSLYTRKTRLQELDYKETSARNIYTIKSVLNNISY